MIGPFLPFLVVVVVVVVIVVVVVVVVVVVAAVIVVDDENIWQRKTLARNIDHRNKCSIFAHFTASLSTGFQVEARL